MKMLAFTAVAAFTTLVFIASGGDLPLTLTGTSPLILGLMWVIWRQNIRDAEYLPKPPEFTRRILERQRRP